MLGDLERIYKFYIKSNLDFISYSAKENTVTYQMWSNRKLGRGIVYSEKKLEQEQDRSGSMYTYLNKFSGNYYSYEEI